MLSDLINMLARTNLVGCCFALLTALLAGLPLQAEEAVKAMAFYEEPLTLHAVPGKQRHLLVVLPQPGINSPVYALKGMVRHEDVEGDAYLQMNNDFGEKGVFFTKGLAPSGPLSRLTGSSDWRPFILPFYANQGDRAQGESMIPAEITLALHLPGAGSVSIRDVRLYQYASDEDPLATPGQRAGTAHAKRSFAMIFVFGALVVAALFLLIVRSRGGQSTR